MRRLIGGLLAGTLVLSACQGAPGAGTGTGAGTNAKASPRSTASPNVSFIPTGPTAPAAKLEKPAAGSTALKGTVSLDAGYLVGKGGGTALVVAGRRVVGADGGRPVGADGAFLVGPDGATAVANSKGQIVAAGAGNVIALGDVKLIGPDGATLIGLDGGTLVGPDGASLVGPDGASLVAAGAGNMVAAGAGNYALAQADAGPALGERAPVAGALVGAIDLRTGRPVPLGQAGGKPVYLVYTDASGGYEVFLDPAVAPHVMIVTSAPGTTDGRLAAGVIARLGGEAGLEVDELQSTLTRYLRACVAVRLEDAFASDDPTSFLANNFDPTLRAIIGAPARALAGAGNRVGYRDLKSPARSRAVQAAVDAILPRVDLQAVAIVPEWNRRNKLQGTALEVMRQAMAAVTERTRIMMQADPRFYEKSQVVRLANQLRPAADPWIIAKPSDMNDMLVTGLLARRDDELTDMLPLAMVEIGADRTLGDSVEAAGLSFFLALAQALFVDPEGLAAATTAFEAAVTREVREARRDPDPGPLPTPPPVAPLTAQLVANLPAIPPRIPPTPDAEGEVAFERYPMPIAVDAGVQPPVVYVGDQENERVLRVAADGTITTLAFEGEEIDAVLGGLAVDAKGDLWVTFRDEHQVVRIGNPRGQVDAVEVIAGDGTKQQLAAGEDGPTPGAKARFSEPEGLAFGPDGALYVVDGGNRRVRRIDLTAPGRPVSTWAGGVTIEERGGVPQAVGEAVYAVGREARFHHPTAIAFGAGGAYILDRGDGRLRFAAPSVPGRPDEAGLVSPLGGGNDHGLGGDDGAALMGKLTYPYALAVAPDGRCYVGDMGHHSVRAWLPGGWFVKVLEGPELQATGLAIEPGPNPRTLWMADGEGRTLSRIALP